MSHFIWILAFFRPDLTISFICLTCVLSCAVSLWLTMPVPMENKLLFRVLLYLTACVIPFPSPNIISTVYDVTVPEARSTALSIQCLIENAGAATAPAMAGVIIASYNMPTSILVIGTAA